MSGVFRWLIIRRTHHRAVPVGVHLSREKHWSNPNESSNEREPSPSLAVDAKSKSRTSSRLMIDAGLTNENRAPEHAARLPNPVGACLAPGVHQHWEAKKPDGLGKSWPAVETSWRWRILEAVEQRRRTLSPHKKTVISSRKTAWAAGAWRFNFLSSVGPEIRRHWRLVSAAQSYLKRWTGAHGCLFCTTWVCSGKKLRNNFAGDVGCSREKAHLGLAVLYCDTLTLPLHHRPSGGLGLLPFL